MERVLVTALLDFDYQGRHIPSGAVVEMPALDAAIHIDERKVSGTRYPDMAVTPLETAPSAPGATPPRRSRRRRYHRKDLTADKA